MRRQRARLAPGIGSVEVTSYEKRFRVSKAASEDDVSTGTRERQLVMYRAVSDVAGRAAFLVLALVAARRLSTEEFGLFVLGSTLGVVVAVASDWGMQLHLARRVAQAPHRAAAILDRWLIARAYVSVTLLVATAIALAGPWTPHGAATPLFLLVAAYLLTGLVEMLHHFYRAVGRTDIESHVFLGQRVTSLAGGTLAVTWRADVTWLAAALIVGPALSLAYSVRLARRLAADLHTGEQAAVVAVHRWHEFTSEVLPLGLGILLSILYFRVDTFMIEYWNGTAAVGLYGAVFRIVDALRLFPAAVLAVALPTMCRAADLRVVQTLAAQLTVAAIAGALGLAAVAPWLIPGLYGAAYAAAVPAFRILLLAFPLMALNYALTQQLIAWNGQRMFAMCCGVALLVNISLNASLLPAWSIVGAAWATVATELALTVGCVSAIATIRARALAPTWQEG
jgi:O-antigen/teichoic acid export membrane protein